ncbi:MAG: hypothetical protein R3E66_09715 [bacterium]
MVHALAEVLRGNLGRAKNWLLATIVGGLIFSGFRALSGYT